MPYWFQLVSRIVGHLSQPPLSFGHQQVAGDERQRKGTQYQRYQIEIDGTRRFISPVDWNDDIAVQFVGRDDIGFRFYFPVAGASFRSRT